MPLQRPMDVLVGHSLPPFVQGPPQGEVHVSVRHVKWSSTAVRTPGRMEARVKWWGERGKGLKFPTECIDACGRFIPPASAPPRVVLYPVRTTTDRVMAYLRDARRLRFDVVSERSGNVLATGHLDLAANMREVAKGIKLPSADCAVPVSDPQNPDRIFGALHVSLSCHIPTRLIEAASHEVQREEEEEAARRAAPSEAEKAMSRLMTANGGAATSFQLNELRARFDEDGSLPLAPARKEAAYYAPREEWPGTERREGPASGPDTAAPGSSSSTPFTQASLSRVLPAKEGHPKRRLHPAVERGEAGGADRSPAHAEETPLPAADARPRGRSERRRESLAEQEEEEAAGGSDLPAAPASTPTGPAPVESAAPPAPTDSQPATSHTHAPAPAPAPAPPVPPLALGTAVSPAAAATTVTAAPAPAPAPRQVREEPARRHTAVPAPQAQRSPPKPTSPLHPRGATRPHSLSDSVDSTASTVAGDALARTEQRAQSRGPPQERERAAPSTEGGAASGGDPLIAAILRRAERLRGEVDAVMGGQREQGAAVAVSSAYSGGGGPASLAAAPAQPRSVSDSMDTVALDMLVDNLENGGDDAPMGGGGRPAPAIRAGRVPSTAAAGPAPSASPSGIGGGVVPRGGAGDEEEEAEERWLSDLLRELSPAEHAGFPSLAGASGSALEALPSVYAVCARASSLVVAPTRLEDARAVTAGRDSAATDVFAATYGKYRVVVLLPSVPMARQGARTRRTGPRARPWEAESSSEHRGAAEGGDNAPDAGEAALSAWGGIALLPLAHEARVQTAAERAAERDAHSCDSRAASAMRRRGTAGRGAGGGGGDGRQGCEVGEAVVDAEAVCPLSFDDHLAARWVAGHVLLLAIPAAPEDRTSNGGTGGRGRGGARDGARGRGGRGHGGTRGRDHFCSVLAGLVPLRSLLFADDLALSLHVALSPVACGKAGVAARDALSADSEGAGELVRRLGRVVWQELGPDAGKPAPHPCGTLGLTLRLMLRSHEGLHAAEARRRRREDAARREAEAEEAAEAARAQPRPWEAGAEEEKEAATAAGDGGGEAEEMGAAAVAVAEQGPSPPHTTVSATPAGGDSAAARTASTPAPAPAPAPAPVPAPAGLMALWFAVAGARLGTRTVARAFSQFGAGCAVRVCVAWKPCSQMGAGATCSGVAVQTPPVQLPRGAPAPITLPPAWEAARWAGEVAAVGNAAVRRVVLQVTVVADQAAKALLVGAVDLGPRPAEPQSRDPAWIPVSTPWEEGEGEVGALSLATVLGSPKAVAMHALSRRRAAMRLVASARRWHTRRRTRRRKGGARGAMDGHPAHAADPRGEASTDRVQRGATQQRASSGHAPNRRGDEEDEEAERASHGLSSVVVSSAREARERSLPLAAQLCVEVVSVMDVKIPPAWPSARLRIVFPPCGGDGRAVQQLGEEVWRDRVEEELTLRARRQVGLTQATVQQLAEACARIEVVRTNGEALGYCSVPIGPCLQQWGRAIERWFDVYASNDAAFGGPGSRGSMVASIGALRVRATLVDADDEAAWDYEGAGGDAGHQSAPPVEAPLGHADSAEGREMRGRGDDGAKDVSPLEPAPAPAPAPMPALARREHETLAQRVRRLRSGSAAQARGEEKSGERAHAALPPTSGWREAPPGEGAEASAAGVVSMGPPAPAPSPAPTAGLLVSVEQASGLALGSRVYTTVAAPWQGAVTARSDVCDAVRGKAEWGEHHALALPPDLDSVSALARIVVTVALWHRPARGSRGGGNEQHGDSGAPLGPTAEVVCASPQLHPRFGTGGAERHTVGVLPRDELVGVACVPLEPLCHGFASVHGWYLVQDASGAARGALLVRAATDGLGDAPLAPAQPATQGVTLPVASPLPAVGGSGWAAQCAQVAGEEEGDAEPCTAEEEGEEEEGFGARGDAVCDAAEAVMRDLSAVHTALERRLYPTSWQGVGAAPSVPAPSAVQGLAQHAMTAGVDGIEMPATGVPVTVMPAQGVESAVQTTGGDGEHAAAVLVAHPREAEPAHGSDGSGGDPSLWTGPASWTAPVKGTVRDSAETLVQGGVTAAADMVRGQVPSWEGASGDSGVGEGEEESKEEASATVPEVGGGGDQGEGVSGGESSGDERGAAATQEAGQWEGDSGDQASAEHDQATGEVEEEVERRSEEPSAQGVDEGLDEEAVGEAASPVGDEADASEEGSVGVGAAPVSEGDVSDSAPVCEATQGPDAGSEGAPKELEHAEPSAGAEAGVGGAAGEAPPLHGRGESAIEATEAPASPAPEPASPESSGEASRSTAVESESAKQPASAVEEAGAESAEEAGGAGRVSPLEEAGDEPARDALQQHEEPAEAKGPEGEEERSPSPVQAATAPLVEEREECAEAGKVQIPHDAAPATAGPAGKRMEGESGPEEEGPDPAEGTQIGAVDKGGSEARTVAGGLGSTHYNTLGSDPREGHALPDAHVVVAQESAWRREESGRQLHDSVSTSESSWSASRSGRGEAEGASSATALDAETRRIARILRSSGARDLGRGERSVASSLLFYSSEDEGL